MEARGERMEKGKEEGDRGDWRKGGGLVVT